MKSSIFALSALVLGLGNLSHAQTFVVDQYADHGEKGTLRWAIEQANSQPSEAHQIQIKAVGQAPFVIFPEKPLPEIRTAVSIVGEAWAANGQYIAIDGSKYVKGTGVEACPGAVSGQFGTNVRTTTLPGLVLRDTQNVQIQGLEVRNFCIGVLINRASNNLIQHNRIMNNYGGAGVMLTGDDGQGGSTATTTNNNKVLNNYFQDNGDGLELTRGAAFNLVANNQFISTAQNPEPSQGIEILWGNDNSIVGNTFKNYSDGLQINWGKRNYIAYNELSHNSIGFNLTGDGNILDSNRVHDNRIGVAIRSEKDANAYITLTKNLIWNNGKDVKRCEAGGSCVPEQRTGAIIMNVPALEHAEFVGSRGRGVVMDEKTLQHTCQDATQQNCNAKANQNITAPTLQVKQGVVTVEVQAQKNAMYRVEFFGNSQKNANEAEIFLGTEQVVTDENGKAKIQWKPTQKVQSITATLTDIHGASSELSPAVKL